MRAQILSVGWRRAVAAALALGWASAAVPAAAQSADDISLSLRDTFPIGSNGLCEAQIQAPEKGAGLFDRRYSIICRDAAAPVGTLWVLKGAAVSDPAARFAGMDTRCGAAPDPAAAAVQGPLQRLACTRAGSDLRSDVLVARRGGKTFAASGLSAYGKALDLGLASLIADKVVPGSVEIPLTDATDALAFARQKAEAIAADQALVEAYRRSNAGNFAEAAEFFAISTSALAGTGAAAEAQLNEGLQQSNLGNFAEAGALFAASRPASGASPVLARLQRNYEAMDALNQRDPARALALLNAPLAAEFADRQALRDLRIGPALAGQLASESNRAGSEYSQALTPLERAQLLDGQQAYLKATALRLLGRPEEATGLLREAETIFRSVRGGRVVSLAWLRAQVLGELAEVAERTGTPAEAEALHRQSIALLETVYPQSPALNSARALFAGYLSRSNRRDEALSLYRQIVSDADGRSAPSLRGLMTPYFALLVGEGTGDAGAAADLFAASQLLVRPGLAQTQAALARELSDGTDEAAQLFRSATNLTRGIEQMRISLIELRSIPEPSLRESTLIAEQQARLEQLQVQQAEVLQKLSAYPRYRAVSEEAVALPDLQRILQPGEAYVKLVTLERDAYVIYITGDEAMVWRADATPAQLSEMVDKIRESIAIVEAGQVLTYPFDLVRARELYVRLFTPVANRLPQVRHIVFEPDGALLELPLNVLVTDDASVARYQQRQAAKDADEYDFRGTSWLGRTAQVSTSVAAAAFRDVRAARPSDGTKAYLGLGENTPIGNTPAAVARTRSVLAGGERCTWSPAVWANPIKGDELREAAARFTGASRVVTGDAFTDRAIMTMGDLAEYRILHFATHGLVTAPQRECPPRPALLTSFAADADSDGLLSFSEIYDLRIDADLVILSACDTAGSATVGATREAGVTSGGEFALDGLVRAFVGAGGRTVLASHWPVPDDFDATGRLISGLFAPAGAPTAEALRSSQLALMDDPETSHPFYWSAFAVVGDGAARLAR